MDNTQVCVLRMNMNCEGCRKKVKNRLRKVHGVHSIYIEGNEAKVTMSSTIDPHILVKECAKVNKRAQLVLLQQDNANDGDDPSPAPASDRKLNKKKPAGPTKTSNVGSRGSDSSWHDAHSTFDDSMEENATNDPASVPPPQGPASAPRTDITCGAQSCENCTIM